MVHSTDERQFQLSQSKFVTSEMTKYALFQQYFPKNLTGSGFILFTWTQIRHNPPSAEWVSSLSGPWNPSETHGLTIKKIFGSWSGNKPIFLNSFSAVFFRSWSDTSNMLHDGNINLFLQSSKKNAVSLRASTIIEKSLPFQMMKH